MICKPCAKAADTGKHQDHPKKCGCDCKHMPRGAWKGDTK